MLNLQLDHQSRPDVDARIASGGGEILTVPASADWRELKDRVPQAVQIDVHFESFKDGRGFTLASQLRGRLGFDGRLRATGHVLPDQALHLKRVGFDEVSPDRTDVADDWSQAQTRFATVYQPAQRGGETVVAKRTRSKADLAALNARYRGMEAEEIFEDAIKRIWPGRIAMMSSFGAEAAVGLHMIAKVAPSTPVLFLDTGRLFAQTEQYQRELVEKLDLTNLRIIQPSALEVAEEDADGKLWSRNNDACCTLRKVRPLDRISEDYDAMITGRKRFHGGDRIELPVVERLDGRIRVNPLASWSHERIDAYFKRYDLPRHPLTEMGYASIGCWTCTAPAQDGDVRSGRWAGQSKSECGIHRPVPVAAE
ncbi:MAG: phosphoadenylyl-sulfate reductase [Alphaproteobacteria bacterium]|nr:phosphoadenylyl-sulfate reductase [Alphaproteobacteria bacterium]